MQLCQLSVESPKQFATKRRSVFHPWVPRNFYKVRAAFLIIIGQAGYGPSHLGFFIEDYIVGPRQSLWAWPLGFLFSKDKKLDRFLYFHLYNWNLWIRKVFGHTLQRCPLFFLFLDFHLFIILWEQAR